MRTLQLLALAMLLGSIPFGNIMSSIKSRIGPDTRLNDTARFFAGAMDAAKVFVPVFLASRYLEQPAMVLLVGLVAILSDCFPYWLMFRPRGRGLAAALGVLAGLSPLSGVGALLVWVVSLSFSGIFSVAAIIASVSAPVWLRAFGLPTEYVIFALAGCAYVIIVHSANISRLISGAEPRWRQKDPDAD